VFPDCKRSQSDDDDQRPREGEVGFNPFGFIGGLMSHFGMTYNQILYEVPYQNLIMLYASVPKFERSTDKDKKKKGPNNLFDMLNERIQ
jgi:hypothetical protein